MKFGAPIEVSGIQKIVINRKLVFIRLHGGWCLLTGTGNAPGALPGNTTWFKTDEQMKWTVDKLLGKLKPSKKVKGCFTWVNRAWVHGDTLNIVRRDAE